MLLAQWVVSLSLQMSRGWVRVGSKNCGEGLGVAKGKRGVACEEGRQPLFTLKGGPGRDIIINHTASFVLNVLSGKRGVASS